MKNHRSSRKHQQFNQTFQNGMRDVILWSFLGGKALMGCEDEVEGIDDDDSDSTMEQGEVRTLFCKGHKKKGIESLSLYNTDSGERIRDLEDGDVISLNHDGQALSIVANVRGRVESVVFSYDGDKDYKTENHSPYAIAGDSGIENLKQWTPTLGRHTLKATAYDRDQEKGKKKKGKGRGKGRKLGELSVYFTVVGGDDYIQGDAVFVAGHSGKVLSLESKKGKKGKRHSAKKSKYVKQYEFDGEATQMWEIREVMDDTFEIISEASGKCLDGKKAKSKGGKVAQYDCRGDDSQYWEIAPVGDEVFNVINLESGLCLDVKHSSMKDGAKVELRPCDGDDNQLWAIPDFDPSADDDDDQDGDDDLDADDDQGGEDDLGGDDDLSGDNDDLGGDNDDLSGDNDDLSGDDDFGGDDLGGDDDLGGGDGLGGDDDLGGGDGLGGDDDQGGDDGSK